jgi:hypothetical protein
MQPWPTFIKARESWPEIYNAQKMNLNVLPTVEDAVAWANGLIERIDKARS